MPGTRGNYGRVLLKLSGEVFGGKKGIGVDPDVLADVLFEAAFKSPSLSVEVTSSAAQNFLSGAWSAHALTTWECSEQ